MLGGIGGRRGRGPLEMRPDYEGESGMQPWIPVAPGEERYSKLLHRTLLINLTNDTFEEGNGTPLQYSCLENPMDGGAC